MHSLFETIWEFLLPVPMPWQAVLILLIIVTVFPLLIFRCLPWLIPKLLQVVLLSVESIVKSLCFFEYIITQIIRKRKRKPPEILYILSDILATGVRLCQSLVASVRLLSIRAFRAPLVLRQKIWYALPLILIPVWFMRPHLSNSGLTRLIDNGVSWWCSLEHWAMIGQWKPSNLTCRYPDSSPRWDTFLKNREYESKTKIKEYTKEIKAQSNSPSAYYNRGTAHLNIENIEAAFNDYTRSVQVDTNYAPGYVGRGDIYFIKGDKSGAFKEYSNAVSANPKYAPGYVGRGNFYLAMNDNPSAIKEFSAATNVDPKYAPGYVGLGDIYQRRQDKEVALQKYRKAIHLDPNYAFAFARIGNLYYRNFDNREAAINQYERAAEISLKNGQVDLYQEVRSILDKLNKYTVYTVWPGDSLSKIAQRYGVSMRVIVSANRETYPRLFANPDAIEIGWKLKIPQ
jgi:tetratricopeptide (TPR) repeat protein